MATDEALPIPLQIADALEAAHEQGIIDRDRSQSKHQGRRNRAVPRSRSRVSPVPATHGRRIRVRVGGNTSANIFVLLFLPQAVRLLAWWQVSTDGGQAVSWVQGRTQLIYSCAGKAVAHVVMDKVRATR